MADTSETPPQPPDESIVPVNIEDEMRRSFLDYSMSVIISRALPSVQDGLKPSQRRILVTFNDLNLSNDRPYRKCAKISGDVSGNYHPHGEAVIYPSIVRLAQPFSLRYPLVDGQGNYGSIDGDPPAAMRYTEARLSRIASEMLADLDRDTVDFVPNYDGTRTEPVVLPARIPNLLINGSSGIAVGMATNIPPHNIGEVIDACELLARQPDASLDEVMEKVPGPDFPTGAMICGEGGIRQNPPAIRSDSVQRGAAPKSDRTAESQPNRRAERDVRYRRHVDELHQAHVLRLHFGLRPAAGPHQEQREDRACCDTVVHFVDSFRGGWPV